MSELAEILIGDGYAAPPQHILEGLAAPQSSDELTHKKPACAPHSIYKELWHIAFWQQMSLDWVNGIETPFPRSPADGFPTVLEMENETFAVLSERFFKGARAAARVARDADLLDRPIRCPSRPGHDVRIMTVREQLESLGAHNAYHLGRIVLLRQLLGAWPPRSGGYGW